MVQVMMIFKFDMVKVRLMFDQEHDNEKNSK